MCGVFGYVSHDGKGPDVKTLAKIATVTQRRGGHAWGMAWIDGAGRLKMYKQTGRITDSLGLLAMAGDARMLIGHCRYATQGDFDNNLNNHPHPSDGGWIVHNGVIRNYWSVVQRFGLLPVSDCDSEVLGLLIEQNDGTMIDRCGDAVKQVEKSPLVLLGLWKPGRIIAVRQGNPLHVGFEGKRQYLASLPDELPGKVRMVKDETIMSFTQKEVKYAAL